MELAGDGCFPLSQEMVSPWPPAQYCLGTTHQALLCDLDRVA